MLNTKSLVKHIIKKRIYNTYNLYNNSGGHNHCLGGYETLPPEHVQLPGGSEGHQGHSNYRAVKGRECSIH